MRFGRGLVIKETNRKKWNSYVWILKCDCGKIYECDSHSLLKHRTQSCGCLRKERALLATKKNLIGKRFGRLMVIEESKEKKGVGITWTCLCDCGNITTAKTRILNSGHKKSCGCLFLDISREKMKKLGKRTFLKKVIDSPKIMTTWDYEKNNAINISPNNYTIGSAKMVWKKCPQCGNTWNGSIRWYSCPKCHKSYWEILIGQYLKKKNIKYIEQYSFPDCKNKIVLRFDFYLPEYHYCIEFNGRQHYEPIKEWGGKKRLKEQQKTDNIKRSYCKNNNIGLLEIPYWNNDKITDMIDQVID